MLKEIENLCKFGAFFISGLASGIVVGLLAAPKSGKELREDIARKSWKWQRVAKDRIEDLEDLGKNQVHRVADTIRNTADKVSSKIEKLANDHNGKATREKVCL